MGMKNRVAIEYACYTHICLYFPHFMFVKIHITTFEFGLFY